MNNKISSFLKRLIAYLLDIIPILMFTIIIFYSLGFNVVWENYINNPKDIEYRKEFLIWRNRVRDLSFLLYCLYAIVLESSSLQGTVGKYIMKIKVIKNDGQNLKILDSTKRNVFKIVSIIPLSLGFIWSLFNKKRKTWHDYFAKTLVVEK